MSFLKVLGTIGKTVGKVALGTVGSVVGVDINGAVFGGGNQPASVPAQTSATGGNTALPPTFTPQQSSGSILDSFKGLINAGTSFLTGQSHAQVDVNTGVGGRAGDPTNPSGLPSWLLPAALAGGGILLISSMSKSRRY